MYVYVYVYIYIHAYVCVCGHGVCLHECMCMYVCHIVLLMFVTCSLFAGFFCQRCTLIVLVDSRCIS